MTRKFALFTAAALFGASLAAAAPPSGAGAQTAQAATPAASPQTPPGQRSLYERLGGIFAISAVVDRFSDAIIANPRLNRNPALVAWNRDEAAARLPGLKVMRTLWIAAMTGGPFEYTGQPLSQAHPRFNLTEEEFNEVGQEIVRALQHFNVPQREQQELVRAYNGSMSDVVSAGGQ